MSKRFTDSSKWTNNKWFFNLKIEEKLFWIFLLDSCDTVGVWEENLELANRIIGYEYPMDTLLNVFNKQIVVFKDGRKWWVREFCDFQYGGLNEDSPSKPIQSYIRLLKKHGLWKEYSKGIHSLKDKDKNKDKDKDGEKVLEYSDEFEVFWKEYPKKAGKGAAYHSWKKINPSKQLQTKILSSLGEHIKSDKWNEDKGKYIPNPTTWLNQERWNDEIKIKQDEDKLY